MLRGYQTDLISSLRASIAQGNRRPVVQAPTGSGKTLVMASLVSSAVEKRKQVLVLAPRRELIYQTSDKVLQMGVEHGVIMAGERPSLIHSVQVACIPTLHRRCIQNSHMALPHADLVLVDEAHLSIAPSTKELLSNYDNSVIVGFTATPARGDGRGLGEVYDDLVIGPTVKSLTDEGWLVPARYFAGKKPDVSKVKIQAGDYQQKGLGDAVDKPEIVGDVVTNWIRIAGDRKTVVFAVNVAHSRHLCEQFKEMGVDAEHIDGNTERDERKAMLQRLRDGDTQVICSCEVLTYGWDEPSISCAVMARPTKSIARYLQMAGRVLRPYDNKEDCIIIDHAGSVYDLGFVDDEIPWTLEANEKVQERKQDQQKQKSDPKPIECKHCSYVFDPAPKCPSCGHEMTSEYKEAVKVVDDDLTELNKQRKRNNRKFSKKEKRRFYGELKGIAKSRGYSEGWVAHSYRKKFGVWPNDHKGAPSVDPSPETIAWVKHLQIQYAKRKAA